MADGSDVKRGQNREAEARTMRSRPRPKIIMKKYQIMISNIGFKAGKINKIPEFYTIFARKIPDYIIRQRGRGQSFETEADAKILASRI